MDIGIIGAGNIGGALARRLTAAGHTVFIANSRGPETLTDLAAETGAKPVSAQEAAKAGAVVIVTIPQHKIPDLPKTLFDGVGKDVVVIDTGNYYPRERDGRIAGIEDGTPESRWVERQLGRPVVKAFNNIYAAHLQDNGKPSGTAGRIALPVSGDDAKAKSVVMGLIDAIGFDTVDVGTIDESWRQQPGTPAYAKDFDKPALALALADAAREREPQWTATDASPGDFTKPA